jgi:hypothetical protein
LCLYLFPFYQLINSHSLTLNYNIKNKYNFKILYVDEKIFTRFISSLNGRGYLTQKNIVFIFKITRLYENDSTFLIIISTFFLAIIPEELTFRFFGGKQIITSV